MFVAGVEAIVETQRNVALNYFEDGSVDAACPPIKALLHIMAHGSYQGMSENSAKFRAMFSRDTVLASDWYRQRLRAKQSQDVALWMRHQKALERAGCADRLPAVRAHLNRVTSVAYLAELSGTIGADPSVTIRP